MVEYVPQALSRCAAMINSDYAGDGNAGVLGRLELIRKTSDPCMFGERRDESNL